MRDRAGHAQYMRAWSAARAERGECVRCQDPIESGVYCSACKVVARESTMKCRAMRTDAGLCAQCGREPRRANRTTGEKCAAKHRKS